MNIQESQPNPENLGKEYEIMFERIPFHIDTSPLKRSIMSENGEEMLIPENEVDLVNLSGSQEFEVSEKYHEFRITPESNKQDWEYANTALVKVRQMLDEIPKEIQLIITNQKNFKQQAERIIEQKKYQPNILEEFHLSDSLDKYIDKEAESFEQQEIKMYEIPVEMHFLSEKMDNQTAYQTPFNLEKKIKDISTSAHFEPKIQFCHQVFDFCLSGNQNPIDLSTSLFKSFVGTQSMIQQISMGLGKNPIYCLGNDVEEEEERSILLQQKLSIYLHENTLKQIQNPTESPQYYEIKDRMLNLEHQKNQLYEQLKIADTDIKNMKEQIFLLKKSTALAESSKEKKIEDLKNQIAFSQNCLSLLDEEMSKKQIQFQELQKNTKKIKIQYQQALQSLRVKDIQLAELKNQNQEMKDSFFESIQNLNNQIFEKDEIIHQLEGQIEQNELEQKANFIQFERMTNQFKKQIEELSKEVEFKNIQNEELESHKNDLLQQIEDVCRVKSEEYFEQDLSRDVGLERIYSGQMEKMKDQYDELLLQKKNSISSLAKENEELKSQRKALCEYVFSHEKTIEEYKKQIVSLKQSTKQSQEKNIKKEASISSQIQEELAYLRKQVVQKNKEVEKKEKNISALSFELRRLKKPEISEFSIDFVNQIDQSQYILELKEIISEYEITMISNEQFIRELETSTKEFINDALEKEKQVEKLEKVIEKLRMQGQYLESSKKQLQADNKKMWRMIVNSGKQISAISNKVKLKQKIGQDSSTLTKQTKKRDTVKKKIQCA